MTMMPSASDEPEQQDLEDLEWRLRRLEQQVQTRLSFRL